jgi:hypothetical protein
LTNNPTMMTTSGAASEKASIHFLLNPEPFSDDFPTPPSSRLAHNVPCRTTTSNVKTNSSIVKSFKKKRSSGDGAVVEEKIRPSDHRNQVLRSHFAHDPMPSTPTKRRLGRQLDMTTRQVQLWFQNQRARARRSGVELDLSRPRELVFHHSVVLAQPQGGGAVSVVTYLG